MKKIITLLMLVVSVFSISACGKDDMSYYDLPEDHLYEVASFKKVEKILNGKYEGDFVLLFGFPSCDWCQALIPVLNEAAEEENLSFLDSDKKLFKPKHGVIYYYDIKEDRTEFNDKYKFILEEIGLEVPETADDGVNGESRISVPYLVIVRDGEILNDEENGISGSYMWDDSLVDFEDLENELVLADLKTHLREMLHMICGCN